LIGLFTKQILKRWAILKIEVGAHKIETQEVLYFDLPFIGCDSSIFGSSESNLSVIKN
jgi:hypothetical protein